MSTDVRKDKQQTPRPLPPMHFLAQEGTQRKGRGRDQVPRDTQSNQSKTTPVI